MGTPRGTQLAEGIRQKVQTLKDICASVDEDTARRAPEGRWCPKEVISHICGPEGTGHLPILRAFLEEDSPTINIEAENPFFTEKRARSSFTDLLSEFETEYERICKFATELSEEQLLRTAHIPLFRNSPLGEYPTLEKTISGLGEYHLQFHIDHMREILQALAK